MKTLNAFIGILLSGILIPGQLIAQQQRPNTAEIKTITILFPDFMLHGTDKKGDTSFNYEYYDKNLKLISVYDMKSIDEVDHIKYYKVFSRFPATGGSAVSAPAEYMLVYDYVHPTPEKWLRYDRKTGAMTHYKAYTNKIVGADSITITDRVTQSARKYIFKYFKTETTGSGQENEEEHHHH